MKNRSLISALAAAVALAAPALGAQSAPRTITFDDAIRIVQRQNVAVLQATNSAAVDAATVRQQKMQFLPNLAISTSTSQNVGNNFNSSEGRVISSTTQSMSAGLASSVTLFDGMRNVAILKGAQLSSEASEQDLSRARRRRASTRPSRSARATTPRSRARTTRRSSTS